MLANTAILRACRVAWDIWEWGRREGELRSLVRESSEDAEQGGRPRGFAPSLPSLLLLLARLPGLSRSVLRQLDSSCLDK